MSTSICFVPAFLALQRDAAPGVDGLTWWDYEADLEPRLAACTTGSSGEGSVANFLGWAWGTLGYDGFYPASE
jgi:hypothetical protein